jgi:hypothetical protein
MLQATDSSSKIELSTPPLVIDPQGTIYRENAFALQEGRFSVMVALPPSRFLSMPSHELIEFTHRTFRLSNSIPLNENNAASLGQSSLRENGRQDCICIEFPIDKPDDFDINIRQISGFKVFTTSDFPSSNFFPTAISALRTFRDSLDPLEKKHYLDQHAPEFGSLFACLNNHAYRLAHLFFAKNKISHIYHSPGDNFKRFHFGHGELDSTHLQKVPLGSPLRKVTCFINSLQLAHFIIRRDFPFSTTRIETLVANINEIRDAKHSTDRKKVIREIIDLLQDGALETQSTDFKNRQPLLLDHIAHSAPLPQDAWKLFCSPAIDSEVKRQIVLHAGLNPQYALALLYEANRLGKVGEYKVKITESISLEKSEISLQIDLIKKAPKLINKSAADKKAKDTKSQFVITKPLQNAYATLHKMRLEAIQKLAQFHTLIEIPEPIISPNLVSFSDADDLTTFTTKSLEGPLKTIGYAVKTESIVFEGLKFFQLTFTDQRGRSYTYETAPLDHNFRENPRAALADLLNFIAIKMKEFDAPAPTPDYEKCKLPEDLKGSGIVYQMLDTKVKNVDNEKTLILLSYSLRLLANTFQLKKEVTIPVGFRHANFNPGDPKYIRDDQRARRELAQNLSPLVQTQLDREIPDFLRWVSAELKL